MTSPKRVTVHTDGACEGNPGTGGWAAVLRCGPHARELAGVEPATTNNRMELQAAIAGLNALKQSCDVVLFTDSEYLRNRITRWLRKWKANGWRTVDRKPVRNDDLWRRLDEAASRHRVTWEWLKGHAGHPDNERCDQLARAEVSQLRQSHAPKRLVAAREQFLAGRDAARGQLSRLLERASGP